MGGSGGGGGSFSIYDPKSLQDKIREAESSVAEAGFMTELNDYLNEHLRFYNQRDEELVNERLDEIKQALDEVIGGTIDLKFGGSVAKHTYVDGLSDVDSLVELKGLDTGAAPTEVRDTIQNQLKEAFPGQEVTAGNIAVTVRFDDGMEIQLIPAVREGNRLNVPSWGGGSWSEIDPAGFQTALTKWNQACGNKLVPTIKLAKGINATLPEKYQLSGYHLEALSIAAFKSYDGPYTVGKMLPYCFEEIGKRVGSPVTDSTGQSVQVDSYLGAKNSSLRSEVRHIFERVVKRMNNASAAGSIEQWESLFDEE